MKKMEDEPTPTTPDFEEGLRAAVEKQRASAHDDRETMGSDEGVGRLGIARHLYNLTILGTASPSEKTKPTVRKPEETWLGIEVSPDDREKNWFGIKVSPDDRKKKWFGIPFSPDETNNQ